MHRQTKSSSTYQLIYKIFCLSVFGGKIAASERCSEGARNAQSGRGVASANHHLRQQMHVCPNSGPWLKSNTATMSPSSSHPISLAEYEANETTTVDVECLTASTTVDPNSGVDECNNANTANNNSRSCSRCGSINSNKSAIVISNHDNEFNYDQLPPFTTMQRKCCASSPRIDAISDIESNCCHTSDSLSRRSSVGHLVRDRMSSYGYGSNTSLSCRSSTPGTSDGHHSRRHHKHSHSHSRQIYYQKHHSLCKRVSDMSSHQTTSSGTHSVPRSHCRHRRKNSCSSTFGDSLRRRKRSDMETCSFHGSDTSIYDPLHVDVGGASSANTVILTPSKITIEHNLDTDVEEVAIDVGKPNRNIYTPSPIQWSFLPEFENHKRSSGRTTDDNDIMLDADTDSLPVTNDFRGKKGSSCPPQCQHNSDEYSVWQTRSDHNEATTNTIMFHHESDEIDNCCGNYYQCSTANDHDVGAEAHEINEHMAADDNKETCFQCSPTSPTAAAKVLRQTKAKESLNNSLTANGTQFQSTSATTSAIHFHKNDISSPSSRRLDLSPDIRRYSKITNLEQQNASNLMPNYFQSDSATNAGAHTQNQANQNLGSNYFVDNKFTSSAAGTVSATAPPCVHHNPSSRSMQSISSTSLANSARDVEMQNLPTSSMYEKPFGSINLTTQNQFEPYSSRRIASTSDTNGTNQQQQQRTASNINVISYPPNTSNFDEIVDNAMLASGNDADNANNNFNYSNASSSSDESLVSDTQNDDNDGTRARRSGSNLNSIFRAIRKRAHKYTNFLKDTH